MIGKIGQAKPGIVSLILGNPSDVECTVIPESKDQDLRDIQAEETTRGKKQPKKALSLARRRMISEIARMLQDPRCDQETYLEVIREYALQEGSDEFRQLLVLWRKRRGND
jgi:hypothetical protein